jgi:hypothetical protein
MSTITPNAEPADKPAAAPAPKPVPANNPAPASNIDTFLPLVDIQCNVPTTDISNDVIGAAIVRLLKAGKMNPTSEDISNTIIAILNNN